MFGRLFAVVATTVLICGCAGLPSSSDVPTNLGQTSEPLTGTPSRDATFVAVFGSDYQGFRWVNDEQKFVGFGPRINGLGSYYTTISFHPESKQTLIVYQVPTERNLGYSIVRRLSQDESGAVTQDVSQRFEYYISDIYTQARGSTVLALAWGASLYPMLWNSASGFHTLPNGSFIPTEVEGDRAAGDSAGRFFVAVERLGDEQNQKWILIYQRDVNTGLITLSDRQLLSDPYALSEPHLTANGSCVLIASGGMGEVIMAEVTSNLHFSNIRRVQVGQVRILGILKGDLLVTTDPSNRRIAVRQFDCATGTVSGIKVQFDVSNGLGAAHTTRDGSVLAYADSPGTLPPMLNAIFFDKNGHLRRGSTPLESSPSDISSMD